MVEGDQRLDAFGLQGRDEVSVISNALRVFSTSPTRNDSGPGDGESVTRETHLLEEGDIFHVLVVAVASHLGIGPLGYVARFPGVPCPGVPDARGLSALIVTSLDLRSNEEV